MWHACKRRKERKNESKKDVVFQSMMPSTAMNVMSVAHE
jgi:hypothetical protein